MRHYRRFITFLWPALLQITELFCKRIKEQNLECHEQCCYCGQNTIKECSGCGWAFYCSRECQEKHWCIHRFFCQQGYEREFPKLEGMNIVPCKDSQIQKRQMVVEECIAKSSGPPCCAICADIPSQVRLARFAGMLICTDCVEIQGSMN